MIQVHDDNQESGDLQIALLSNVSMSLDRFFAVFLILSLVMLLVALYPVMLGLWPVMVIAATHVVLVGWCFRQAWRGNWARQTLHFGTETVTITHRTARQYWTLEWPIVWLKLDHQSDHLGQPRLYLQLQGRSQEIGSFLPANERAELGTLLTDALSQRTAWVNT